MLSIDEAIAHAREEAKEIRENIIDGNNLEPYESYCNAMTGRCAEEHEQLAEWLEELKIYQQHEIICNKGYNAGYNKAIDDFVKLVHKHDWNIRNINENSFIYGAIDTLAEQLKEGGENE